MAILDDATQSGRDTWHVKKAWTANIPALAIAAILLGLGAFVLISGGAL